MREIGWITLGAIPTWSQSFILINRSTLHARKPWHLRTCFCSVNDIDGRRKQFVLGFWSFFFFRQRYYQDDHVQVYFI